MFDLGGGGGLVIVAGRPVIPTPPVDGGSRPAGDRASGSRASAAEQSGGGCELPGLCAGVMEPNICIWFCAQGTIVQEGSVGAGAVAREVVLDLCVRGQRRLVTNFNLTGRIRDTQENKRKLCTKKLVLP